MCVIISTMGSVLPSYYPSPPMMTCSKKIKSTPKSVRRYLPNIILHLSSTYSYMWHSRVTTFVVINVGMHKSTLTFLLVINFLAFVLPLCGYIFLMFDFWRHVSHDNQGVKYNILSYTKFLYFALNLWSFILPCIIVEW